MESGSFNATDFQGLLGYLNFSTGRPDPRIQAQLFRVWETLAERPSPRLALHDLLNQALTDLHAAGLAAFKEIHQARAVLDLALRHVPAAYRLHHQDLLLHLSDPDLFSAGFCVRAFEAVLAQQGPWDEVDRITAGAMRQLNDYVGHRPIAVLESRPRGEPYDHEKVRPVPLFLRGAGVVPGRYAALVTLALDVLRATPAGLQSDACLEFDHLDELAFDPRGYDHQHPADKRPNYRFGEWDPHHIDNHGYFRRFVVRQIILDGLLDRVHKAKDQPAEELLREAATVLAGTMLMASGISGAGPDTHDSSVNLANLMPDIARYREAYYNQQLAAVTGGHGERLRKEATAMRQPFGGARQHINQYLAEQRAAHLQERRLAMLVAELGYPEAARKHAASVAAAPVRMLSEIHIHLTTCQILAERGKPGDAADHLALAEAVLHRAIDCGASVDPWNILGFQGFYPLFNAREDSVRDQRIDELVYVVDRLLTLYAHLRSEAATVGDSALGLRLATQMENLARWWDRFATTTVSEVRPVNGSEAAASAEHVAEALGRWRENNTAAGDLAFWRQYLDRFQTAKSFALVVEELLRKNDFRAAMGLLMSWLSQADAVPLQDGEHSFHTLALRWMLGLTRQQQTASPESGTTGQLIRKFIDHLEANAEDYWQVPRLEKAPEFEQLGMPTAQRDDEDDAVYGAAYEDVTYQDSTDDGVEGELLGFEPHQEFALEREGQQLEGRLRFLSTVARLFHLGSRGLVQRLGPEPDEATREIIGGWLARARRNYQDLLALMESVQQSPIPAASGSNDSLVEYDRRHTIKERLLTVMVGACLEWALAIGGMVGVLGGGGDEEGETADTKRPRWEPLLQQIEKALWQSDTATVQRVLPKFLERFQHEPLLFTPLGQNGNPRLMLRATIAQTLLRALAANLPRLGLLRETYAMLRVALNMERSHKQDGPLQTNFDGLYQIACQACIEAAVIAVNRDETLDATDRVDLLGRLMEPFVQVWADYSKPVRVSALEGVPSEAAWESLRNFIRKYGNGLFHARFMTHGNLRGILQQGVGAYLKYLEENPDPLHPVALIDDLDRRIPRAEAEQYLQWVLQAAAENYGEYKDYNNSTPRSDYGENLHTLLDFLRLKMAYARQSWLLRPLGVVHEVLAKHSTEGAVMWQREVERLTADEADSYVKRLEKLEAEHGMRLRTVSDRLRERFVQPLALDRVCALIEPAYEEARAGQTAKVLEQLELGWRPYLDTPSGAGLDVPMWLMRLEAELHRVKTRRTAIVDLAESFLQIPRLVLAVESLRKQLEDWPRP